MALIASQPTLWHNPRCAKSRAALALLQDNGVQTSVRLYLKDPPSAQEIIAVRNALGVTADDMIRKGEAVFKELGLATALEADLIDAMAAHPILIERPIFIQNGKAAIGRPPEDVLKIL